MRVTIWEMPTGRLVASLNHPGGCRSLAFGPDSRRLATSSGGKTGYLLSDKGSYLEKDEGPRTVKIWEVATGNEICHLTHDDLVGEVSFSAEGKWLATSSFDKTARLWESETGRETARLAERSGVSTTRFIDQGTRLLTLSRDYHAQIWEQSQREGIPLEHEGPVTALAFSPNGKWLATGSQDRTARLWETATGQETAKLIDSGINVVRSAV